MNDRIKRTRPHTKSRPGGRIILHCTSEGRLRSVVEYGIKLASVAQPGEVFINLVDEQSVEKAGRFLDAVKHDGVSFNWEINLKWERGVLPMRFTGVDLGDGLMLLGQVADALDQVQLGEMTKIMNEMAVLQRAQAKQTAELQTEVERRKTAEAELKLMNERLEQMVTERTTKLTAQNAELESFVYSVSHDLSSPLVSIAGFAGLLERDLRKGDQSAMRDSLMEINKAVEILNKHIQDLLLLSRIGRVVHDKSRVSVRELVEEVWSLLEIQVRAANARLKYVGKMPEIMVDRRGFHRVFINLIENAIKYRRRGVDPVVEIEAAQHDGELRLAVRDNGIGIKHEYQEKIFGLFQRADSETEGTGVGLAISKRVVEAHGGRIWVESLFGSGSSFCIGLPESVMAEGGPTGRGEL